MQRRKGGFTRIELLVVIVVIGVLATLVAPNVFRHVGAAKDATARSQIEMLGAALDAYRLDNGRYPTTQQGIAALWNAPVAEPRPTNWRGAPYSARTFRSIPGSIPTYIGVPRSRAGAGTTCSPTARTASRAAWATVRGRSGRRGGRLGSEVRPTMRAASGSPTA